MNATVKLKCQLAKVLFITMYPGQIEIFNINNDGIVKLDGFVKSRHSRENGNPGEF